MCLARGFLVRRCPRLPFSQLLVASPALRIRHSCPFWCPRGLAWVFLCSLLLPFPLPLARSAFFAPSFWCSALPFCLMSRGDELRQLAAQLSVLAALEDSIALGLSRVMGPAGSGRSAAPPDAGSPSAPAATAAPSVVPSPSHEVATSFVALSDSHVCFLSGPHSLPFPCAAAQTCTASQLQDRLWLVWFGCSREVGTGHGLGHQVLPTSPASPAAPFPRLSRSPRCFSRLAATCRRLRALCTLSPGLRGPPCCADCPTPMMTGTLSSTNTASPRLLVAPRPPSPSRPTPLELVGVLATSVAVASAKPPSAPCGGKFDVLSPAWRRWLWVWSWTRAHF